MFVERHNKLLDSRISRSTRCCTELLSEDPKLPIALKQVLDRKSEPMVGLLGKELGEPRYDVTWRNIIGRTAATRTGTAGNNFITFRLT